MQAPELPVIAWTVVKPAIAPVTTVRNTRPMKMRRKNFASA